MALLQPKDDLLPGSFEATWDQGQYKEALHCLRGQAEKKARNCIKWYYEHRVWPCRCGRFMRLASIILLLVAGVLPLLNEIYRSDALEKELITTTAQKRDDTEKVVTAEITDHEKAVKTSITSRDQTASRYMLNPVWASVALVVAGTLIFIDRFYGASTGWVRYVVTAQRMTMTLEDFQLSFEEHKSRWASPEPSLAEARETLVMIRDFVEKVNTQVQEETNTWVSELSDSLKQLDEQARLNKPPTVSGLVEIRLVNAKDLTKGWNLSVDGQQPETKEGENAVLNLPLGPHLIHVSGEVGGVTKSRSKAVHLVNRGVVSLEFILE